MGYEHLEHDGNEDFAEYETRGNKEHENLFPVSEPEPTEDELEEQKAKLQKEWLSLENPALWEGDFDDD